MSFLRYIPKPSATTLNIIVPLGMLLRDLNHGASVAAFNTLAKNEDVVIDWNQALPLVFAADAKVKAGGKDGLTMPEFIATLRGIFSLKKASDEEICHAWNQMLGDLSTLAATLEELKTRHANKKLILVGGTNPPHVDAIQIAAKTAWSPDSEKQNPLQLCGLPWHVSFLQTTEDKALRFSNTNLIDETLKKEKLDPNKTLLMISLTSTSPIPAQKKRDEDNALALKNWAEQRGLKTGDFKKGAENFFQAVEKAIASLQSISLSDIEIETSPRMGYGS